MDKRSLKRAVGAPFWEQSSAKLKSEEAAVALRELFDHVVEVLAPRIDDVKTEGGKAVSFYAAGREFLTINVGRENLRVYVHPPAGVLFEPEATFDVEKFRFWEASFQKKTGKFRGMSFWVSAPAHVPGARAIIDRIAGEKEGGA
jgi:hypothetical protein